MLGFGTHIPSLLEAISRTPALPVLELGMGDRSTLILNELERQVFSYENDEEHFSRYKHLRNNRHFLAHVRDWSEVPIESQLWSVVLVDHAPVERRQIEVGRLLYRALVVVCHDTEEPAYQYERRFQWYRHRLDVDNGGPRTSLLSNYLDVSQWSING
jgi:hypothetical protein